MILRSKQAFKIDNVVDLFSYNYTVKVARILKLLIRKHIELNWITQIGLLYFQEFKNNVSTLIRGRKLAIQLY